MTREEAIKIVKEFINGTCLHLVDQEALETLIPELAKSKDERIKKIITDSVFYQYGAGVEYKDVLDYLDKLEKQKEQKLFCLEPIFRVGDTMRTWEEAREGITDGLPVVTSIDSVNYICTNEIIPIARQNEYEFPLNNHSLKTQVKEQKTEESISQLTVQGKGVYKICPRCKERMVRDDSKVYTSMPPQYGYKCPKCGEMEFDTVMYDNPEMEEQKPAEWSEEDEKIRQSIIKDIEFEKNYTFATTGKVIEKYNEQIAWLKSLPLNLKKKNEDVAKLCSNEWGVEDEDRIRQIERIAQQAGCTQKLQEEIHNWLKSLRPSWKPSEEQMKTLKNSAYGTYQNGDGPALRELYQQLKKQ